MSVSISSDETTKFSDAIYVATISISHFPNKADTSQRLLDPLRSIQLALGSTLVQLPPSISVRTSNIAQRRNFWLWRRSGRASLSEIR